MKAGSNKYSPEVKESVIRWFALTDLGQRDIAFLAGVPQTQVSRWARDPEFMKRVEECRQRAARIAEDEDEGGGEWSPTITTFRYVKPGGGK